MNSASTALALERRTVALAAVARRRLLLAESHPGNRLLSSSSSDPSARNAAGAIVEHEYERIKGRVRDEKDKLKQKFRDRKHRLATTIAGRRPGETATTTTTTTARISANAAQHEQDDTRDGPLRLRTAVAERLVRTVEGWAETTTTTIQQDEPWRGMTALERAQRFPVAAWALWQDGVQYQNIVDATQTPHNAWTHVAKRDDLVAKRLALFLPGSSEFRLGDYAEPITSQDDDENKNNVMVPWRQLVQQRQFIEDLTRVIVPLIVWIPPIVGWLPTILSVTAPRPFFTRHFHNDFETVQFAWINQEQRQVEFPAVIKKLCKQSQFLFRDQYFDRYFSSIQQGDAAGPLLLDPVGLYRAIFESSSPFYKSALASVWDIDQLPVRYVQRLALAMGLYQSLPGPWMNQMVAKMMIPPVFLRAQLRRLLFRMVEEDAQLLLEGHDQTECQSLSNQEVLDACLMRNLPIVVIGEDDKTRGANLEQGPDSVDYQEMRRNLSRHLQTMDSMSDTISQQVQTQFGAKTDQEQAEIAKERLGLFAAHVAILRHGFSVDLGNQR